MKKSGSMLSVGIKLIISFVLWAAAGVLTLLMGHWHMVYLFDAPVTISANPISFILMLIHLNKLALVIGILAVIPILLFFPIRKIGRMPDGWKKFLFIMGMVWLSLLGVFTMFVGVIYFMFHTGTMSLLE